VALGPLTGIPSWACLRKQPSGQLCSPKGSASSTLPVSFLNLHKGSRRCYLARKGKVRKEGRTMALSFRIVMHQNRENLHLRLIGDFDGSSAFELLEVLKERAHAVQKVFIHTNSLGKVHPFGQGVFEKRAPELKDDLQKIHFTGHKAELVSPGQSLSL
jgi:hypothetical protein